MSITIPQQQNVTTEERDLITGDNLQPGIIIFNTTVNTFQGWNGTEWVNLNE